MFGRDSQSKNVKKLRSLIRNVKCAMLTTRDDEGRLVSRPMATQRAEFDGVLWFFTSNSTPKIADIRNSEQVNVSYSDPDRNRYVSVSGRAEIVRNRDKMEELWHPALKAWFPKGLDDPEIALLRVNVESAEYWDSPGFLTAYTFGLVKALATGRRPRAGRNRTLQFA